MKAYTIIYRYACVILMLWSVMACHEATLEEETSLYDRTVLVYMAAENSLAGKDPVSGKRYYEADIDEMLQAVDNIPDNCRLLVYVDDRSLPRMLSVERNNGKATAKVVCQYEEEHNSGDTLTLRVAMQWMVDNYASQNYGLVLWSHGESWVPARSQEQRVICVDDGKNSWMEIDQVAEVLEGFPRLDFIMFDACFMQAVEVAYELRRVARYIVASPAEIPNPGAPYERIVKAMFGFPLSPQVMIAEYYRHYKENNVEVYAGAYYGVLLSVIDCDFMDDFAEVTREMLVKYVSPGVNADLSGLLRYYPLSRSTRPEYYDMNAYMRRIIVDDNDYYRWKNALNRVVPRCCATPQWFSNDAGEQEVNMEEYSGVSCYVPQNKTIYSKLNAKFANTSWYEAAGWKQIGW